MYVSFRHSTPYNQDNPVTDHQNTCQKYRPLSPAMKNSLIPAPARHLDEQISLQTPVVSPPNPGSQQPSTATTTKTSQSVENHGGNPPELFGEAAAVDRR